MEGLTRKQKEVLEFIRKESFKKGFSPTLREIMQFFGFKSLRTVQDYLKALEKKGYIHKDYKKSRSIILKDLSQTLKDTLRIPVLGQISAGKPIFAEENIQGYINLDKALLSSSKEIFALKVEGDSMIGAGILDKDFVIVKKQSLVENGEIACVLIDNQATVKRFYKKEGYIELKPENPNYRPIIITKDTATEFLILGKVIGLFRKIAG